jgi:pimeloyl-ACP methyl ester carboxylesterase
MPSYDTSRSDEISAGSSRKTSDTQEFDEPYHPFRSETLKEQYLASYDAHAARWPVVSNNRFVETPAGTTFVRIQGPLDGPPLVLLPGDSENSLAWIPVIAALSETYRTYALDHINDYGRSIYRRKMRNLADLTQWLDEVLDALDLNTVHLLGHSYGGWQAALYARAHPERLTSLILLSPVGTVLPQPLGLLVRAFAYGLLPFRVVSKRYMYWYDRDCARDSKTRPLIDELSEETLLARRCFKRKSLILSTVLSERDWQGITAPTLYLVGEDEVSYAPEQAVAKLREVAPAVQAHIAPGGDHHIMIVKPQWFVDHLLRFLGDRENGRSSQTRRLR